MKLLHLSRPRQRGLTLVEMMIGLGLGLFVAAALLTLYANASNAGQNLQRASTQIENGRYATELLTEDLQMAGYYGEMPAPAAYTLPDPCATDPSDAFAAAPLAVPAPVRGYGAAEALDCLQARSRRAGTDALAVRRLDPAAIAPGGLVANNRQYYLQHS
ncbi:Type IV fimbrial biogenesis protein PilW [Rubrivivax sp. A210]|uniref:PilW family protein n=1 Tax=Rubrivivax sp. A210 TaxID=2772301 RepID=UPI001919FE9E|nr:prepilin-type N-terminal cleavage/methylation domain-containing protein [Rubrivivax sp. A210]CAD5371842.1 Type IV fimbrial biogenesis protein PilW [Rubrivivax sp. A210]